MDNKVIIAIAAVIVLVCAGAGIALAQNGGEGEKEHTVTVQNSLGEEVEVTLPLKSVCVVNTNAAEFLQILGATKVVTTVDNTIRKDMPEIYGGLDSVGDYKAPDQSVITDAKTSLLICQSSSRSLSADTETSLEENCGITVLRLDCYGSTMLSDVETLVTLLESSTAFEKFEEYKDMCSTVRNTVITKSESVSDDLSYLLYFTSNKAFYNVNSELDTIPSSIGGHNCLGDIVKPGKGVSDKPSGEALYNYMQESDVDYIFIRGTAGKTPLECYEAYLAYDANFNLADCSAGENQNIYVIHTDVLSGPRDFIGYVCLAEIYGVDTGYDYDELVKDFNTKYGFGATYSYIISAFPVA